MKTGEMVSAVLSALEPYQPQRVILYVSRARGVEDDYSDIDLIVIKDTQEGFFQRLKTISRLLNLPFAIDVLVYTPVEMEEMLAQGNPFLTPALEEGTVIYEGPGTGGEAVAETGRARP